VTSNAADHRVQLLREIGIPVRIAQRMTAALDDEGILSLTAEELRAAGCLERTVRIAAAALTLARTARPRATAAAEQRPISMPAQVCALVAPRICCLVNEVFVVVPLTVRNKLMGGMLEVARGHASGVEVRPREVFRPLLRVGAVSAVLVHNHPSGDPTPSEEDVRLTRRMVDAGTLIGIEIVDHIVVASTPSGYVYRSILEVGGHQW